MSIGPMMLTAVITISGPSISARRRSMWHSAHHRHDGRAPAWPPPALRLRFAHDRHDPAPGTSPCRLHKGRRGDGQVGEHGVEVAPGAGGEGGPGSFRELVKGKPPTARWSRSMVTAWSRSESLTRSVASPSCWGRPRKPVPQSALRPWSQSLSFFTDPPEVFAGAPAGGPRSRSELASAQQDSRERRGVVNDEGSRQSQA